MAQKRYPTKQEQYQKDLKAGKYNAPEKVEVVDMPKDGVLTGNPVVERKEESKADTTNTKTDSTTSKTASK